ACGTSLHAGMVGEYYFEDLTSIPVEVEQAAEFRYRNPILNRDTMVIAISQSGETADTLAAIREAKQKGALVASICNVVGSTIARETGRGIYLHAGPEIGVASTKAFTCQVTILLMMALKFGRTGRLSRSTGKKIISELEKLPEYIKEVLNSANEIAKVAKKYHKANDFFYIGRGYLYPVALEGALKLKEISYIHAEGYHAAELKHGPIALLDENVPVLALANKIPGYDKILGNMQECLARKSPVIAVATKGDKDITKHSQDLIEIPECSDFITPIVSVVALQLFAYYIARERGCPIDQPRNLAKSVTVE
ncbi:MAG TPA: glutamine--fructose-6-phosphate transaminase (isomerizing), partial [Victivallales bacterium]|nr:glutamine--fructose-6-phosphate transaminase (isomerizing) [Victivallales bacterium]